MRPAAPPDESKRGRVGWICNDVIVAGPSVWMSLVRWMAMTSGFSLRFLVD